MVMGSQACALLLINALAPASAFISPNFASFVSRFGKTYADAGALSKAESCWTENVANALRLNALKSPKVEFGETSVSDICWDDFEARWLRATPPPDKKRARARPIAKETEDSALRILAAVNNSADWRPSGAVAPVQNQAQCGSCWAFGTVANMEAQHFLWSLDNGTFVKLSEQQLVSCDHFSDKTGIDQGCQGGWPDRAIQWTMNNGGLTTEDEYPYVSGSGNVPDCDASHNLAFSVDSFHDLGANETFIAAYVAKWGPVVIGLQATSYWQQYTGGILAQGCEQASANHAVAIVGFGSEGGTDYWIIRNSWGAKWGEDGYIRLARNAANCNGVVSHVTSAYYGNRSTCLEECKAAEACCNGDCCPTDGDHACAKTGCCAKPDVVCGDEGGNECCPDAAYCGAGVCCDPAKGKKLSKDGQTCCDISAACGDDCCPEASTCCGGSGAQPTCCDAGHICCGDQTDTPQCQSIVSTCCADGGACQKGFETCCMSPVTGESSCCGQVSGVKQPCRDDGTCGPHEGECVALFAQFCADAKVQGFGPCNQCTNAHRKDYEAIGCSVFDAQTWCTSR